MSNSKYRLIGGVCHTSPDEVYSKAINTADLLLKTKRYEDMVNIIKHLDNGLRTYMKSPLVDFMHNNIDDRDNWLITASLYGYLEVVLYLTDRFKHTDDQKKLAAQLAAYNGHLDILRHLVKEQKADVRADNDWAFQWAVYCGHLDVVKYLVEECKVNIYVNENFAMRWAYCLDYTNVAKYLQLQSRKLLEKNPLVKAFENDN